MKCQLKSSEFIPPQEKDAQSLERHRHTSLLRQLKAEFQKFRRKTLPSIPRSLLDAPKEQPTQPDPSIVRKTVIRS